jgi:hypothetical protein
MIVKLFVSLKLVLQCRIEWRSVISPVFSRQTYRGALLVDDYSDSHTVVEDIAGVGAAF